MWSEPWGSSEGHARRTRPLGWPGRESPVTLGERGGWRQAAREHVQEMDAAVLRMRLHCKRKS